MIKPVALAAVAIAFAATTGATLADQATNAITPPQGASASSAASGLGAQPAGTTPIARKAKLREGTEVPLVFVEELTSATAADGDRFNVRVDADVKADGVVLIPAGAMGVGTVTSAHKKGFMGKAGDLNVMLDYVKVGDERVRIRASKGKEGKGKVGTTVALTVLFGPIGLLKRGHDIVIKARTPITAFVDSDYEILVTQ